MKDKNKRWKNIDVAYRSAVWTVGVRDFSHMGANLVDGLMTSLFLGTDAMAAVGLGGPIFSMVGIFGGVLGTGLQNVCAEEIGRGKFKSFNSIVSATALAGFILSIVLTLVVFVLLEPLAKIFGANGNSIELLEPTKSYILGVGIGIPAIIMEIVFSASVQLDNGGSIVRKTVMLDTVLNAILDYVSVVLGMGLFGMGLATSVARYLSVTTLILVHFAKKDRGLHLKFKLSEIGLVLKVIPKGAIMIGRRTANVLRPILLNNYIVLLGGTSAMTALSVKNNVSNLTEVLLTGVAGAVSLMVGIAYGEKSKEDILRVGHQAHKYAIWGNGLLAIIIVILAYPIADLFVGANASVHSLVVFSMYMLALELITQSLIEARISYLNVTGKYVSSQVLQFGLKLLALIPCVLIMGTLFGVYGVLAGFAVAYAVLLIIVYAVTAVRNRKLRPTAYDYLRLDDSFDIFPGDIIELDIRNKEDAVIVSHQIQLFCKGHKMDDRKSYRAALALEEISYLVFESNNVSPEVVIDIRAFIQNNELTLRIRDNGKIAYPFGISAEETEIMKVTEMMDVTEMNEAAKSIGLKILRASAKEIKFFRSLKMNYTIIIV